jgi:hypothetical protein
LSVTYTDIQPSAKFAFPRSYIKGIQILDYDDDIVWTANVAVVSIVIPGFTGTHTFIFRENFFEWNSNVYTLDYPLERVFYVQPPDPVEHDTPVSCDVHWDINQIFPVIRYAIPGAPVTLPAHPLPPAPPDWWSG